MFIGSKYPNNLYFNFDNRSVVRTNTFEFFAVAIYNCAVWLTFLEGGIYMPR